MCRMATASALGCRAERMHGETRLIEGREHRDSCRSKGQLFCISGLIVYALGVADLGIFLKGMYITGTRLDNTMSWT